MEKAQSRLNLGGPCFVLGCLQAVLWWLLLRFRAALDDPSAMPLAWFLPVAGGMSGWLTNDIALRLIFQPVEPRTYCCGCITMHGLFLRRQAEVSKEFAAICAEKLVTAHNCWERILFGPRRKGFEDLVTRHVDRAIDEQGTRWRRVGLHRSLLARAAALVFPPFRVLLGATPSENLDGNVAALHHWADTPMLRGACTAHTECQPLPV